jgi:hypothetical protein
MKTSVRVTIALVFNQADANPAGAPLPSQFGSFTVTSFVG